LQVAWVGHRVDRCPEGRLNCTRFPFIHHSTSACTGRTSVASFRQM